MQEFQHKNSVECCKNCYESRISPQEVLIESAQKLAEKDYLFFPSLKEKEVHFVCFYTISG